MSAADELVAPKTLYVGNLDSSVSEDLLCALFSQIGNVKGCKIIREMASTLLCVLLMGQQALGVLNKSPAQSSSNQDKTDQKDEIVAEDRIISDVYGAPPQLSNDYGPPLNGGGGGGGGFNGPAPVYGPPELTGNHGPVQVYPPPPPDLPPPPPQSYGLPRKPKPQYGPPKQSFGPASPGFGPKPGYGPPKLNFGSPSFGFSRPPKPQYGPPQKFSGPPNLQFGPPRFGGSKPGGHGPPIPISLETYGPPNKGPSSPFASTPQQDYGPPPAPNPAPQHQAQHGPPAGDLYGPPPPPPPGVPAPPTPPDIKYDGWQPIAGLVGAPNHHGPSDSYGPPDSSNGHFNSHGSSSSGSSSGHSSGSHSSSLILDGAKHNVPSDSYGEPIHNPDAHNLQSSVHESTNSHGLPPPPLPQSEPLHNNQGPAQSIAGHQEHHQHQHQHHDSGRQSHQNHQSHQSLNLNQNHHQFGSSGGLLDTQYGLPNGGDLKAPGFPEFLPEAAPLTGDLHGLSLSEGSSSSFATSDSASGSFHADLGSSLSLPTLTLDNFGAPLSPDAHHDSHGLQGGDDLTLQQLPLSGPSLFSGASFGGHGGGNSGLSLPPPPPIDSYGAPPASSYSPSGSYPLSQGGRGSGSSWLSAFNIFGSSGGGAGHKQHGNGHHHHHHHRNHGPPPPFRHGPPPALTGSLIPPRSRAPIKFREQVPSGLLANINRYLPPVTKPSINYGAPLEQQLPSLNGPLSFQSSSSSSESFGNAFSSSGSFGKSHQVSIAAPNVHYGTPLSFNNFNTPAPVLTYGAPNFGPATSFISTSLGSFGANHNLYNSVASNALTATYGTPVASISSGGPLGGGHDCGFQKSGGSQGFSQFASFDDVGHQAGGHQSFGGSLQLTGAGHSAQQQQQQQQQQHSHEAQNHHQHQQQQNSAAFANAGAENSLLGHAQQFTEFPGSSISDLDLESHERQQGELKDSYGNPVGGLSFESSDQTPALTTNEIHSTVGASSGFATQEFSQHSHHHHHQQHQQQNSFVSATNFLNDGASAEALTAALTAQGYSEGKNFASNELAQDASGHYSDIHPPNSDEAIALAQTLQADGADGFQIQGSKGTYMLQIQAAGGGLGTENSDGSIRHDQVLSNGLLQDILAAIEQPGAGPVEIQGPPQPQQLQHVYDQVSNGHHRVDGTAGSHGDIVEQVLAAQSNDGSSVDLHSSAGSDEHVALFYNNNSNNNNGNGYDESKKEIRSTSKSEAQASLSKSDEARENGNGSSQAEATKKSS